MARTSKRSAPKPPPELGPEAGPTFGEVVTGQGLVAKLSKATRDIIGFVNDAATEHARVHLQVVSCFTCTVPSCCSLMVDIYLYEAVPMVARLLAEGRDTPELRARLAAAAHAMETTRRRPTSGPASSSATTAGARSTPTDRACAATTWCRRPPRRAAIRP
jgi:hypothetical protein